MVGTVKKKLCPTGNGTEFSDNQAVLIDRIMIENIILLKLGRVIYKIIVYGIITNYNIRIIDNGIQINSLIIIVRGNVFVFIVITSFCMFSILISCDGNGHN